MSRERLSRRLTRNTVKRNREVFVMKAYVYAPSDLLGLVGLRWQWIPHLGVARRISARPSIVNGKR